MNPSKLLMPNMMINPMSFQNAYMIPRNIGLIQRITSGIRSINLGKLLSGANKTLNVMNQTIPLIRQAKPMISNVRSMVNLVKEFRSETTKQGNNFNIGKNNDISNKHNMITHGLEDQNPIFFI